MLLYPLLYCELASFPGSFPAFCRILYKKRFLYSMRQKAGNEATVNWSVSLCVMRTEQ